MRLSRAVNIADLRALARRRLPRVVFDYLDGGAEDEVTLLANTEAFQAVTFRPHYAVPLSEPDLRTRVLGSEVSFPALLAPVGYSRLMHPGGEAAAARAAGEAGTVYILSTISGHPLEAVRAASRGPVWFQLYQLGGRAAAEDAIRRAHTAGYAALVVTIDTPVAGLRERDARNGTTQLLGGSLLAKLPFLPPMLLKPRWLTRFLLDGGVPRLPNVNVPGEGPMRLMDVNAALSKTALTWDDFRWIRELWKGPLVVKGVLSAEDARRAVDVGAAAVVVSNHGGRQLDGAPATLRVLPEIAAAVGDKTEVLLDGGVRRGSDIVKAICLGARAVLVGRAYAYGLAAGGEAGVARALNILKTDVARTLRLIGCSSIAAVRREHVTGLS
jgi:L-lactate dehydrogenase (cytochrome)